MTEMENKIFEIGAEGIDSKKIMEEIAARVRRKMEEGAYRDARISAAERFNMANIKDDESFFQFYLDCLRGGAVVDINDFEMKEKRKGITGKISLLIKKVLWQALKFYTYRLWTQQNQINNLFVTAIETLEERYKERITVLEKRVKKLEDKS
jgi:hypothetical protein